MEEAKNKENKPSEKTDEKDKEKEKGLKSSGKDKGKGKKEEQELVSLWCFYKKTWANRRYFALVTACSDNMVEKALVISISK